MTKLNLTVVVDPDVRLTLAEISERDSRSLSATASDVLRAGLTSLGELPEPAPAVAASK